MAPKKSNKSKKGKKGKGKNKNVVKPKESIEEEKDSGSELKQISESEEKNAVETKAEDKPEECPEEKKLEEEQETER